MMKQGSPAASRWQAGEAPPAGYRAEDRYRDFRLALCGTLAGRHVLAQILARCRVWERSYVAGDTHETARREGMRDVGLWLLRVVNTDPARAPSGAEPD